MGLLDEIREQPEVIARTTSVNAGPAQQVAGLVSGCTHAVIAARGTSDNAGRYAQYVWGTRNGLSVGLTTPSLFSVYDRPPRLDGALVVGISQSGESPDIVSVLDEGRKQGRPTVAITNEPDSPLADVADVVIDLHAGEERAVAATKTYTAQLAVVALISEAMAGKSATLDLLSPLVEQALTQEALAAEAAAAHAGMEVCVVLGRGFNQATAFEWALKLQELTQVVAQPFSTADFLHGPIAVLEPGYPVLAIAARGPAIDDVVDVLDRCRQAGASLVVIGNDRRLDGMAPKVLQLDADLDEWLSPIPAVVLGQLFAYHLTVAKGLDPEQPRGLHKVTRTT
ncbi:MAG TPA: SIS domain-containing protein [Acidimicrobiia bacterium]|nr:SIS domain-containing protein [Acidimicrobiia bacterium]